MAIVIELDRAFAINVTQNLHKARIGLTGTDTYATARRGSGDSTDLSLKDSDPGHPTTRISGLGIEAKIRRATDC